MSEVKRRLLRSERDIEPGGSGWLKDVVSARISPSLQRVISTWRGQISLEGPVNSGFLAGMEADVELGNFRPPERQLEALVGIADMEQGMVFIARQGQRLVGYLTLLPPDDFERWSRMEEILELGAIEIAGSWRGCGLARGLLEMAFSISLIESYIIVATEYYWHWDMEAAGLSVWGYRRMLEQLFNPFGMKVMGTSDPEICSHPANALMVRIGSHVDTRVVEAFYNLRYGAE